MHVQRICVPATWRARLHLSALANHGVLIPREVLNAARRDLGAGPTWGRTVGTLMLFGYSAVSLLLVRAGLVATTSAVVGLVTVGVLLAGTAGRLGRGIDVNRWLTVNPRHQRGSCQWLIWRGEQTGHPCVHCLAGMSRQERRHWLEAAASPAVVAGWIGDLPASGFWYTFGAKPDRWHEEAGGLAVPR